MLTMRGFAKRPLMPSMEEVYGMVSSAIAVYPMYRGLARLVGMSVLDCGSDLDGQVMALKTHWDSSDFFFFLTQIVNPALECFLYFYKLINGHCFKQRVT